MEAHKVAFTYLNIRQSIVLLLSKLIVADIILSVCSMSFYFALMQGENFLQISLTNSPIFLIGLGLISFFKIMVNIYIVLQWLNEYYEVTPEYIYHKKGIIFKKVEQYRIDVIRRMDVKDTFLGQIFNFATITLYDLRLNKYLDMYLIHNPKRYANVLKVLKPDMETEEDTVHMPFIQPEASGSISFN